MSRIIGCNSLHIAEVTKDDAKGTTWGTPTAVPSLISISVKDQKENVTFYSDDNIEQVIPAFSGKEVSIELGYLTAEIEAMISGNTYKNGLYVQKSDAVAKEYALLFKAPLSRGGERYCCLFKGVLAKDESEYKGKGESIESSTTKLTGVFMPLLSNGLVETKADSTDANISEAVRGLIGKWFTEVPQVTDEILTDATHSAVSAPKVEKSSK
ncbi:hypothetical protein UT300009_30880 [Paraclostridium bifermentans]